MRRLWHSSWPTLACIAAAFLLAGLGDLLVGRIGIVFALPAWIASVPAGVVAYWRWREYRP